MSVITPAVEQALYSIAATADDLAAEGQRDRAALLRACAATLEMKHKKATMKPAPVGQVERGVGRPVPEHG